MRTFGVRIDRGPFDMLTAPLRKQGGATVVTLPSALLKGVQRKAGDEVLITVRDGGLVLTRATDVRRFSRFTPKHGNEIPVVA